MLVAGIDPGIEGGISIYNGTSILIECWDMPIFEIVRSGKKRRDINDDDLVLMLEKHELDHVFLELVHGQPGDGSAGSFSFGRSYGIARGVIAALKLRRTFVTPQMWKKKLAVTTDKNHSRMRASQLIPGSAHYWPLVKHHGRAESALIAKYGWDSLGPGLTISERKRLTL